MLATTGLATSLAVAQSDPLAEPFPPVFELGSLLPSAGGNGLQGFVLVSSRSRVGLGVSVDAADVDGDGIDDVIAGSIGDFSGGTVYVVFGIDGFRAATRDVQLPGPSDRVAFFRSRPGTLWLGNALSKGDLNGDGFEDLVVGASGTAFEPIVYCQASGDAFAVFGRERSAWPDRLPIETQPRINPGCDEYAEVGAAVDMGDFDGDGIDDIIVAAPHPSGSAGFRPAYVSIFRGGPSPFVQVLVDIEPTATDTLLGARASFVGDVNGDGLEDVVVNEPDHPVSSRAYVIYGGATGPVLVNSLTPDEGLLLEQDGWPGGSVPYASVGDVNGDGLDDWAFSDSFYGDPVVGAVYVVYGRTPDDPPLPFPLGPDAIDGEIGFAITGKQTLGLFGSTIAAAGDLNGDGIDDMLVSARGYDARGVRDVGATYLIYGQRGGSPASTPVDEIAGTVRFEGVEQSDRTGSSVGSGDVNGDGVPDIIISASGADDPPGSGRVYIVYGRAFPCPADLDGDGDLTILDFLAFQNLFDDDDPIADFDGDGDLTLFDFLTFQNAFDAGCP